jgi:deoxyribodipyrimidine photo-lyase
MSFKYQKSLFVFRRDLRLYDNTALNFALENSKQVIPAFIFDPRQISNNAYFSDFAFKFLLESLKELSTELESCRGFLYLFEGKHEEVITELVQQEKIHAVFFNRDYTPFSRQRDKAIYLSLKNIGVDCNQYADCLINEPENALKPDKTPYTVFTPFFKRNSQIQIKDCASLAKGTFYCQEIVSSRQYLFEDFLSKYTKSSIITGGRKSALVKLQDLPLLKNYSAERDIPALNRTSCLSAHLKFGTISVRELLSTIKSTLGQDAPLIRQLYWRDFFHHIAFHFPHVFKGSFHKKYDQIDWSNDSSLFQAWCEGKTGFPIVDAGMQQLVQTGTMHNRLRMITASFLVKDLHIDWRWGEKFFAQYLVDYDPCINNGNWQWAASTGCDAQPYFRIFNPWLQQEKFDPDCVYIKTWLPELEKIPPKAMHSIYKNNTLLVKGYPLPIVNHQEAASIAKDMYEK